MDPNNIWLLFLALTGVAGQFCEQGEPVLEFDIEQESDPSVFDDLTTSEITAVYNYMKANFDVVEADQVTIDSAYVYFIERRDPPKAEVLAYMDGKGPKPDRNAWVVLYRGNLTPPKIEEYQVGPLPAIQRHTKLSNGGKDFVDYHKRAPLSPAEHDAWNVVVTKEMAKIDNIMEEVTGYKFNNCADKCLLWMPGFPAKYQQRDRSMWVFIVQNMEGAFLHPVGLQFRIDAGESLNTDDWVVRVLWFRGTLYLGVDDFVNKYTTSGTRDEPLPVSPNSKELFSSLNQRGGPVPTQKQRGPTSFLPDGRRYTVNKHHVTWQDWSFYFNVRSLLGIQVHDLRFRKERIAYELSLSEIGIVYSGVSPSPSHSAYIDSPFYFGLESFELVPGIDCPKHATFFDFAHFSEFMPILHKNSVCVFEQDRGIPIRRHFWSDTENSFTQGMPDNVLILRAAVTVYNYEYILDHVFHQNGVVEVVTSLSGYILSSYSIETDEEKTTGFKVIPNGIGQIHNHMVQFKVDLDIGQTNNRFTTLDIEAAEVPDPADPSKLIYLPKFEHNLRETEMDARYKYNFDTPKYLVFSDNDKRNKYGNNKSYRLLPVHMNKHILPESYVAERAMSWQRYQVSVTKQKDSERRGSSIYNLMEMLDPVVSFSSFSEDNENIVDEDLVAWLTLGVFHIPSSEDIPIVQTPSHSLTYFLLPFNYFDEDPSLASRDNIRVTYQADGERTVERVGVEEPVGLCDRLERRSSGAASSSRRVAGLQVMATVMLLGLLVAYR